MTTEAAFFKAQTQFSEISGFRPVVCAPGQGSMWESKPSLCPSRGLYILRERENSSPLAIKPRVDGGWLLPREDRIADAEQVHCTG